MRTQAIGARHVAAALVVAGVIVACTGDRDDALRQSAADGGGLALPGEAGAAGEPADPGEAGAGEAGAEAGAARCTRASEARTAPVSLWDAFTQTVAGTSGSARTSAVEAFLADVAAQGGTPLEDPGSDRVVFLGRGPLQRVVGTFVDWDAARALTMTAIDGTDLHVVEARIPRGASFEYKLLRAGDSVLVEDPLAVNVAWDGVDRGLGARGEFNALGHPQDQAKDKGRLVYRGKRRATKLGHERDVWVYYPARYDDGTCAKLPSVVFQDGREALTRGGYARAADALYAARPDLSAVLTFVGLFSQEARVAEYSFGAGSKGDDYVDFVTGELWPWLATDSRVCSKAEARGIAGASLGGLIATYAALEKPGSWGWVGAQSASYWWAGNALVERVKSGPKVPVRIYLDSGCPTPEDNCDSVTWMAAALTSRGYDHLRVTAQDAQHDWSFFKDRAGAMLTHFREGQTACD